MLLRILARDMAEVNLKEGGIEEQHYCTISSQPLGGYLFVHLSGYISGIPQRQCQDYSQSTPNP